MYSAERAIGFGRFGLGTLDLRRETGIHEDTIFNICLAFGGWMVAGHKVAITFLVAVLRFMVVERVKLLNEIV